MNTGDHIKVIGETNTYYHNLEKQSRFGTFCDHLFYPRALLVKTGDCGIVIGLPKSDSSVKIVKVLWQNNKTTYIVQDFIEKGW